MKSTTNLAPAQSNCCVLSAPAFQEQEEGFPYAKKRCESLFLPRSRQIPVQDVLLRLVPLCVIPLSNRDGAVA